MSGMHFKPMWCGRSLKSHVSIRLENLEAQFRSRPLFCVNLSAPLDLGMSDRQLRALLSFKEQIGYWGVDLDGQGRLVRLHHLFVDRAVQNPKAFRDLLMAHIQELEQGRVYQLIPEGFQDLLNSLACRSAIMFGDPLSSAQCQDLLGQLKACKFPFQCGTILVFDMYFELSNGTA